MKFKTIIKFLFITLFASSVYADTEWLIYDQYQRIPYLYGQGYSRDEYHWWVKNTGEPSRLFQNGVFISQETGTNDIRLSEAWKIWPQGVTIGVVDVGNIHGQGVQSLAKFVSRNNVLLSYSLRLYPEDIATGISNYCKLNFKIIVVTTGFNVGYVGLSNACRYAELKRALIFCAVPNAGVNIDITPDYPSSWANNITSIVPITSTDRNGNLYGPGAAAWGTYVVGAPGRNIAIDETYTSGTSRATAIAAGSMAILMQYRRTPSIYPNASELYRNALWGSVVPANGTHRLDVVNLLKYFD